MEAISHIDLLCRACASPLGEEGYNLIETPTLFQLYIRLSTTNISPYDLLPKSICAKCHRLLHNFQDFQRICAESHKMLFDHIKSSPRKLENCEEIAIKNEISSEVDESTYEFNDVEPEDNNPDPLKDKTDQESIDSPKKYTKPSTNDDSKDEVFVEQLVEVVVEPASSTHSQEGESIRRRKSKKLRKNKDVPKGDTQIIVEKPEIKEGSRNNPFVCRKCSKKFYTKVHYEGHLRMHEGKKPYACQQCSREYSRLIRLKQHVLNDHTGSEFRFYCTVDGCEKKYRNRQTLKKHMNRHFSPQPIRKKEKLTVICELCGKTLSKGMLREHEMMHKGIYPHACDQCPKKFRFRNKLEEHKLVHLGIKKHSCAVCGMKKTTKRELKAHMNIHTREKEYPCHLCKSCFLNNTSLVRHIRVVHDGIKTFHCTFCDQSFGKSETLKHHMMRHTGEKPHKCPYCDRKFIQKAAMKIHARRHNSKTDLLADNS